MHDASGSVTTSKPHYSRVVAPLVFILALNGVAGCGSSSSKSNAVHTRPASSASPSSSASSAVTSATGVAPAPAGGSAAGDVTLGTRVTPGELGSASVRLTVTNHSSVRSDYAIGIALVAPNGTQLATKTAFVNRVRPGQSVTRPVNFLQSYNEVPAGTRVTLGTVQRYPEP